MIGRKIYFIELHTFSFSIAVRKPYGEQESYDYMITNRIKIVLVHRGPRAIAS